MCLIVGRRVPTQLRSPFIKGGAVQMAKHQCTLHRFPPISVAVGPPGPGLRLPHILHRLLGWRGGAGHGWVHHALMLPQCHRDMRLPVAVAVLKAGVFVRLRCGLPELCAAETGGGSLHLVSPLAAPAAQPASWTCPGPPRQRRSMRSGRASLWTSSLMPTCRWTPRELGGCAAV